MVQATHKKSLINIFPANEFSLFFPLKLHLYSDNKIFINKNIYNTA